MKCTQCNERNGNTRCEGCNTLFCLPCMSKHHDELVQQFQLLMDVRNEVKQLFDVNELTSTDGKQVSCFIAIDEWEREMIKRIQQITAQARTSATELITKNMKEISHRFEQLSVDMQQRLKEGDYLENDINRITDQLDQLQNDIKQVNKKIRVDSAMSNNINWDTLIYIVENEVLETTDENKPMLSEQAVPGKYIFYIIQLYVI